MFNPNFDNKIWYYDSVVEYTKAEFETLIPSLSATTLYEQNIDGVDFYCANVSFRYLGQNTFIYLVWDFRYNIPPTPSITPTVTPTVSLTSTPTTQTPEEQQSLPMEPPLHTPRQLMLLEPLTTM
jgi:hypothetical protein